MGGGPQAVKPCPQCRQGLARDVDGFHRVGRQKILCSSRPVARPEPERRGLRVSSPPLRPDPAAPADGSQP